MMLLFFLKTAGYNLHYGLLKDECLLLFVWWQHVSIWSRAPQPQVVSLLSWVSSSSIDPSCVPSTAGRCSYCFPGDTGNTCPALLSSRLHQQAVVPKKLSQQHFPARLSCTRVLGEWSWLRRCLVQVEANVLIRPHTHAWDLATCFNHKMQHTNSNYNMHASCINQFFGV